MKRSALFFILTITLSFVPISEISYSQDLSFYYDEGIRLRDTGNFERAAEVWTQGARILDMRDMFDPRIGIAMIEMVTAQELEEFYEYASNIYIWGFSSPDLFKYEDVITKEAEMIMPLLPLEKRDEWKELLKDRDNSIGAEIRRFWIENDPVQTTVVNERLVEHWQRIDFVRTGIITNKTSELIQDGVTDGVFIEDTKLDLKKNKYSPYGTDDRGVIYVKYGHPDEMKNQNLLSYVPPDRKRLERFIPFDVLKHKRYDYYSIWKYTKIFPDRPLIFIFGSPEGESYKLIDGLDDFIPESAYRGNTQDIPPGTSLQFLVYEENMHFDPFFMKRYNEIKDYLLKYERGEVSRSYLKNLKIKYNLEDKNNPDKLFGPQVYSEYDQYVFPIDIIFTQSRILDAENSPKIAVTAMSYIEYLDNISIGEIAEASVREKYTLVHSIIIRDSLMNEISRDSDMPSELYGNTSAFVLDHTPDKKHFTIAADKYDPTRNKNVQESISSGNMPFSGHKTFEVPEPLDPDPVKLELSDLVTGYKVPEVLISKGFPFPVIPGDEIPIGENMLVYLEVYHLMLGSDSNAHYSVEFKVARSGEKGLLARLRGRTNPEQVLSQSHNLDSRTRTAKENVEFDISDLEPGEYEFEVEVTDLVSGQKKLRDGKFRIRKK
ncbi:MAG: hypothetical protein GY863_05170 [bacterium]|nr:hypothetical protein [bacterium]